jgi:2-polyprenyl-3-methyl-5-hydroxy-6-metoxy-1,4-benzoquinol methylase
MTVIHAPFRPETRLQVERVACTHCGSNVAQRLFTEQYQLAGKSIDLGINRCRRCELIYVSPRLTPEATRLVYELDAADTISHNYCWDGDASESRFDGLLDRLTKLGSNGRLLDVGCGGGHFLRAAKRRGIWDVIGLEPIEKAAIQAARYAGCDVRKTTVDDAEFPAASFDVISLLGVLEHVHEPLAVLRSARSLLRADGLLAIYVPNYLYLRLKDTGLVCYARTRHWSRLHPQEHLHQFTPRTLAQVLRTSGFEVLQVDVGRPFASRHQSKQLAKQAAYAATCGLKALTGVHLGGLEVIARPSQVA